MSPISLKSDYVLKNLAGKTTISANRISIKDTKTGGSLDVKKMLIKILIEGSKPKTPIYGEYSIESDDIRFYETPTDGVHIHMASKLDVKVKKVTDKYSDIEFKISAQAKDETTEENWLGIKSLNLEVSMKNLGVEGMQEIYKVQEEQNKIQARLQKALIDKDDVALIWGAAACVAFLSPLLHPSPLARPLLLAVVSVPPSLPFLFSFFVATFARQLTHSVFTRWPRVCSFVLSGVSRALCVHPHLIAGAPCVCSAPRAARGDPLASRVQTCEGAV